MATQSTNSYKATLGCLAACLLCVSSLKAAIEITVGGEKKVIQQDLDRPLHPMLKDVIEAGPYAADWADLSTHGTPDWFSEDKIGYSAHWGVYSVPGWTAKKSTPYGVAYAEWYRVWMEGGGELRDKVKAYHAKTYGDVPYSAFINGTKNLKTGEIEGFFTEDFDADQWMKLLKAAGAKYFFLTSKHHDGFCLFDSEYTDRNSMKMGPKRDLIGELATAARANGLRFGLYYSYLEWHNPYWTKGEYDPSFTGLKRLEDRDGDGDPNEYVDDFMIPQIKEIIDKYQPDYLCFDGEWVKGIGYWRSDQILAYYYNQAAKRGQEVAANDRFFNGSRGVLGDFTHVEYHAKFKYDQALPWAMWRGFGNSFGYNQNEPEENILSIQDSLRLLVDVVASNGNIEYNLTPKSDGTFPEFELERLQAIAEFVKVNSEAIYNTTASPFDALPFDGNCTVKEAEDGAETTLYFTVFDWPEGGSIGLPNFKNNVISAQVLGSHAKPEMNGRRIENLGAAVNPHATVVAVTIQGTPQVEAAR